MPKPPNYNLPLNSTTPKFHSFDFTPPQQLEPLEIKQQPELEITKREDSFVRKKDMARRRDTKTEREAATQRRRERDLWRRRHIKITSSNRGLKTNNGGFGKEGIQERGDPF